LKTNRNTGGNLYESFGLIGKQLAEKYKENFDVSSEGLVIVLGRILWHEKSLRKRIPLPGFGHYFETR
jgi:hypothetical protein